MEREVLVSLDLDEVPVRVGRLWVRARGDLESCSFEYDRAWLARRGAFSLDPDLPLTGGQFHTQRALFNAFTDPAPDRWGQTLLRRYERFRAKTEGRKPRALLAIDFLTLVDDETRLGALRLQEREGGPFVHDGGRRVPPLIHLPRLLAATGRIVEDKESVEDLQLVLAPGTSLGGARPKASVRGPDGSLFIAKFPKRDDDWPVTRWEAATLALAEAAGLTVPRWRLETVLRKPVLLLQRFDRNGAKRVPFSSALTALGASDNEDHSYLELIDVLRREGADVEGDLKQLWRRVVFNLLVSNTDDHLRNHAFLRVRSGWKLAPAYDLNPVPTDVRPRVHALAPCERDHSPSFDALLETSPLYGLSEKTALRLAREVAKVVKTWRKAGAAAGLKPRELERMESAFEHEDLAAALGA